MSANDKFLLLSCWFLHYILNSVRQCFGHVVKQYGTPTGYWLAICSRSQQCSLLPIALGHRLCTDLQSVASLIFDKDFSVFKPSTYVKSTS